MYLLVVLFRKWPNLKNEESILFQFNSCKMYYIFHRVTEQIREKSERVDKIISCATKIFIKAPMRVKMCNEMYPIIPLIPESLLIMCTSGLWGSGALRLTGLEFKNRPWHLTRF